MTQTSTVGAFFAQEQILKVPAYQRSYAWLDSQINQFIKDLEQHPAGKPYFYGTLLLELTGDTRNGWPVINVVDGQQRLTTLSLFFHSIVHYLDEQDLSESEQKSHGLLSRKYLYDKDAGIRKFETVDSDLAFFHEAISSKRGKDAYCETLSQKRLLNAYEKFCNYLQNKTIDHAFGLCEKISSALVIPFTVSSPGEATQIFELQNDRGKRLTNLESLKAYLMHRIFLAASEPDQQIRIVQGLFERLFRTYEKIEDSPFWNGTEDDILRWYAIAYSPWPWWQENKVHAHTYLKDSLTKPIINEEEWVDNHITEILDIAVGLEAAFSQVLKVLNKIDTEQYRALTDLFALNRLAPFWPILLKLSKYEKNEYEFELATRSLEIFCMRAYAIIGMKSGSGEDDLFKLARLFNGDYLSLANIMNEKSKSWRDLSNRFDLGLNDPEFYYQGADARYFYWRYENYLRTQPGKHFPKLTLKDYFSTSTTTRFSIEHIAAQKSDDQINYSLATIDPYGGRGATEFREKFLHSIGNLVLDCHSPNASKGNSAFPEKVASFQSAPLVSQNELRDYATKSGKSLKWDKEAIDSRKQALLDFAMKTWTPLVTTLTNQTSS